MPGQSVMSSSAVTQPTWVARLAIAAQLQLLAPRQDVLALRQGLDMVEPAE